MCGSSSMEREPSPQPRPARAQPQSYAMHTMPTSHRVNASSAVSSRMAPSISSSGAYYPGPNFAPTVASNTSSSHLDRASSGGSAASQAASILSMESAKEVLNQVNKRSIERLARQISIELHELTKVKDELDQRAKNADPKKYSKRDFSDAMDRAYHRYKELVLDFEASKRQYDTHIGQHNRYRGKQESDVLVDGAKLALGWANAAFAAGKARIEFLTFYRDAFGLKELQGHISAGEECISSAQKAVDAARKAYRAIFTQWTHEYSTTVPINR